MERAVKSAIILLLVLLLVGVGILLKSTRDQIDQDRDYRAQLDSLLDQSRTLGAKLAEDGRLLDSLARNRTPSVHTVITDHSPLGLQAEIDKRFPK